MMKLIKIPLGISLFTPKKPVNIIKNFAAKKIIKTYPKSSFIGICGTVGKTTAARFCQSVLTKKYPVLYKSQEGVSSLDFSEYLLNFSPRLKKIIVELPVTKQNEMDSLLSIVTPETVLVTRISYGNNEFLGNIDQVFEEYKKPVQAVTSEGLVILNWDDYQSKRLINFATGNVMLYGTDPKNCHVWADNIRLSSNEQALSYGNKATFELNFGVERVEVALAMLGKHSVYDALSAACLGVHHKISLIAIKKGLEAVQPLPHQLKLMEGINGFSVLDDSWDDSPAACEEAIDTLSCLPARRRIVVLGPMKNLGVYSEMLHRKLAQKIYNEKVDTVLLTGGETHFIAEELSGLGFVDERVEDNLTNSLVVAKILKYGGKGDIVLIKGAKPLRLDEVVKRVTKPNQ